MNSEAVLGLANYEVTSIEHSGGVVRITARYLGSTACPDCQGEKLRSKGRYLRKVRHETWGMRHCWLILEAHKWLCRACGRGFRQQFPGNSEVAAGQRIVPANDFLPALGWS